MGVLRIDIVGCACSNRHSVSSPISHLLSSLQSADVDGTLTAPRKVVTPEMLQFLADLRKKVTVGVVGGSDLAKAKEQLGEDYLDIIDWSRCVSVHS